MRLETGTEEETLALPSVLQGYERVLRRHGIPPKNDSIFYRTLIKMSTKGRPWAEMLQELEQKESLKALANNKYDNGLLAKCLLKWIGLLVQRRKQGLRSFKSSINSVCENKENRSVNSNDNSNSMACFTFAKKELSGRAEDYGRVEEFASTAAATRKAYDPSSRRLDRMFGNLSEDEGNYRLQLKYLRKWKRMVLNARRGRAEKERRMENWLVGIHFYEQTLCSKGLLGLLHHKQELLRVDQIAVEVTKAHSARVLIQSVRLWRQHLSSRMKTATILEKLGEIRRRRLTSEAMHRLQLELVCTERLALRQRERMSNPVGPIYMTLLWLQDSSCLRWLRTFDQELQALPPVLFSPLHHLGSRSPTLRAPGNPGALSGLTLRERLCTSSATTRPQCETSSGVLGRPPSSNPSQAGKRLPYFTPRCSKRSLPSVRHRRSRWKSLSSRP